MENSETKIAILEDGTIVTDSGDMVVIEAPIEWHVPSTDGRITDPN